MNTKWPKNKNIGDIYTNNLGVSWRWNGKGWSLLKEPKYPIIEKTPKNIVCYRFNHDFLIKTEESEQNLLIDDNLTINSKYSGFIREIIVEYAILGDHFLFNYPQKFILKNITKGQNLEISNNIVYNKKSDSIKYSFLNQQIEVDDELEVLWISSNFEKPIHVQNIVNVYLQY